MFYFLYDGRWRYFIYFIDFLGVIKDECLMKLVESFYIYEWCGLRGFYMMYVICCCFLNMRDRMYVGCYFFRLRSNIVCSVCLYFVVVFFNGLRIE